MEEPEYFKTTLCIRYNDLQIAEQEGKVRNQKPGGAENTNDAPAEDTRQEKNAIGGTRKKIKQLELLGFIGTDKMARVDEDVNNRLFRREIRILTLLL